jgi:hypothetical protein
MRKFLPRSIPSQMSGLFVPLNDYIYLLAVQEGMLQCRVHIGHLKQLNGAASL